MVGVRVGYGDPGVIEGSDWDHHYCAGDAFFDGVCPGFGQAAIMPGVLWALVVDHDAIDAGAILFEFIEGEIILNEEKDDQGGADADREPEDVDEREGLVAPEVAEGDAEIVF